MPGFYIAGTNAAGFDFDPDLWEKRPGWDRFELQIGGSILNDGGHGIFAHNWGGEVRRAA
jgi:hypothetical protein